MDWETLETKAGLTLKLAPDTDADCPFEDDTWMRFLTNVPRYMGSIGWGKRGPDLSQYADSDSGGRSPTWRKVAERIRADLPGKGWSLYAVRAYIHSGIALSLTGGGQFSDPWDSGLGGILCIRSGESGPRGNLLAKKNAAAIVETLNQWLSGDVYGYAIENDQGETIESVWGFFGRDYAEQEARAQFAHYTEQEEKEAAAYANQC